MLINFKFPFNIFYFFLAVMRIRQASLADYEQIHAVRMAVKENVLSDPAKVTFQDYENMLLSAGRGWVCELRDKIVGFAIVDITQASVWALFVLPEFEGKGIGQALHERMLRWSFGDGGLKKLYLSTDPGTRAEAFYRKAGWKVNGMTENGERRFELVAENSKFYQSEI